MANHVICIEASDCQGADGEGSTLTKNKVYPFIDHSATGWLITNDRGENIWVGMSCFRLI